jgi:hypothetical protein
VSALEFFRFLLVARIAIALILYATGLVPLHSHRLSDTIGPFFALLIQLPLLAAAITATVGVWLFHGWARNAYIAVALGYTIISIVFPSREPCEYSAALGVFAYFLIASQAVLITMMFLPPVADRFEHAKT